MSDIFVINNSDDLAALRVAIVNWSTSYYNGEPEVSNEAFDFGIETLRAYAPNDPLLTTPGWGAVANPHHLKERNHHSYVTGLAQVKIGAISPETDLMVGRRKVLSAKLDGVSIVLNYDKHGCFTHGLTRHTGDVGLDVTHNLTMAKFPRQLRRPGIREVRGEVVISHTNFEKIKDKYSNPRNAVSGILNSHSSDPEVRQLLEVIVYAIPCSDFPITSYTECLNLLKSESFNTVMFWEVDAAESAHQYLTGSASLDTVRGIYDYLLDGIVIASDTISREGNLNYPVEHLKVKYPASEHTTTVTEVVYELSGYNRAIPVVWFEPVDIDGVTVQKASGFNAQYIKSEGIGVGTVITITRRNEVIPHIETVVTPTGAVMPTELEGYPLKWEGVHLRADRSLEPNIVRHIILGYGPRGLGGKIVCKFTEAAGLTTISKLGECIHAVRSMTQLESEFKDGFNALYDHEYEKIVQSLNSMAELPVTHDYGLEASWTDSVGSSQSSTIAEKFSKSDLVSILEDESSAEYLSKLAEIYSPEYYEIIFGLEEGDPRIWEATNDAYQKYLELVGKYPKLDVLRKLCRGSAMENILENRENILKIYKLPLNWTDYSVKEAVEAKFTIQLTGKLSKPRGKLLEEWAQYGVVQGSGNQYLVCDAPSDSAKFKAATAAGIEIITETEFRKLIGA